MPRRRLAAQRSPGAAPVPRHVDDRLYERGRRIRWLGADERRPHAHRLRERLDRTRA